jgi:hypothetical protein
MLGSGGQGGNPVLAFFKAVGISLTNLDVPFRMQALFLRNVFCSQAELTTQIVSHYSREAILQGTCLGLRAVQWVGGSVGV